MENQEYNLFLSINPVVQMNYVCLNRNDILYATDKQKLIINLSS